MSIFQRIQILNLEVDTHDVSDFRLLVDGKSFKYVTIDAGVYKPEEMTFDRAIIPLLPSLPEGDWNEGHIAVHPETGVPYFSHHTRAELPEVLTKWHPNQIDWLDLQRVERLRSNVYTAAVQKEVGDLKVGDMVVIKFARFPWEMHYFEDETKAYRSIDGSEIGPKFLGHLTEGGGRVIGLVIEYIPHARHAGPDDVEACQAALRRLHRLGKLHGDVNRYNFLVREDNGRKTVRIVDFESVVDCGAEDDDGAFDEELDRLRQELHERDGKGGFCTEIP